MSEDRLRRERWDDQVGERLGGPTRDQRRLEQAVVDAVTGRKATPIHEVLLDEAAPASELVRAHLRGMSDEDLEASWYKLEMQSRQLAEDPESSDWVRAGWDAEHAATMIGCSFRATDGEMMRREALKK